MMYNNSYHINEDFIDEVYESSIYNERLLHYIWQQHLWQPTLLRTKDGKNVEVINNGRLNINAGPDFFGATIRIDNTIWVGNIEIHLKSSDWYLHGHDKDDKYNNVILHICLNVNKDIYTKNGIKVPQVEISIPQYIMSNYHNLIGDISNPPCHKILSTIKHIEILNWLDSMCVERMEQKIKRIDNYIDSFNGDWERIFFIVLARSFGFGVNADVFELWAKNIPLTSLAHHRDNLIQVEAFFFGQAGMLNEEYNINKDEYWNLLHDEYLFLKHKFNLSAINPTLWKYLRMRPQNFPTIRIAQLAKLYHKGLLSLQSFIESNNIELLEHNLTIGVSEYWTSHYTFGNESRITNKVIQKKTLHRLILNAICPILFAYGKYLKKDELLTYAFDLLEQIPPEDNYIIRKWADIGIDAKNAADSQALIQIYNEYCQRKKCLRCVIGREYLKTNKY